MKRVLFLTALTFCLFSCATEAEQGGDLVPLTDATTVTDTQTLRADTHAAGQGELSIEINHQILSTPLELQSPFSDSEGVEYQINQLRYWVSNLVLMRTDGSQEIIADSYFLIEITEAKTRTTLVIPNVPAGTYDAFQFGMGVDEARNHSTDLFVGELSTTVDMDWGWNSGFIFFKLEGSFRAGTKIDWDPFKLHLGYDVLYKVVELSVPDFQVNADQQTSITIDANVDELFEGMNIPAKPSVVGGPLDGPPGQAMSLYTTWFTE